MVAKDMSSRQDVTPVLVVDGLAKNYDSLQAVRGISFEMRRGEVLGFLGPNGAGKSTTVRCILDLLRPSAGRIRVFGLDPHRDGVAVRSRLTYIPGELRLPDRMTGSEMADSLARLRGGYDPRRRDELAERLRVDLGRQNRQLSSGNRRKLALLLAFLWPAEMLVLDEPTTGLDPLMQHEFLLLVGEARSAGASIFLSSHVLSEVQRAADRVIVLRSGTIVAQGTVEELRSRARQRVEVWFERKVPAGLDRVEGLADGLADGRRYHAYLVGSIRPLLRFLAAQPVVSMLVEEPDLEEAFLDLYQEAS
jgi:ABC-2 type transport system ATP-binding protein